MSHGVAGGWGVRKVPKKCHTLFEWPPSVYLGKKSIYEYLHGTTFNRFVAIDDALH